MTKHLTPPLAGIDLSGRLTAKQRGFTLLEVLVAIVVLSLGLLGLAGLQALSLRNNQIAYYRAIASQQAYDMGDRMRANLGPVSGTGGVRGGDYDNLDNTTPADPGCIGAGCTPTNMEITDHFQWNSLNARLLPGGVGTVVCAVGPTGSGCTNTAAGAKREFDITLMWTEKDMGGSTDPNCPAGTAANIRCFVTRFAP